MSTIKIGGQQTVCPAGSYSGVCSGIYDLGLQPGYEGGDPKERIAFRFEISKKIPDGILKGKPFEVWKTVNITLNEKSTLRHLLQSWRGHDLTPEEIKQGEFDPGTMLGETGIVTVSHVQRQGRVRAEVTSVVQLPEGMPKLTPVADPNDVPAWIRKLQETGAAKAGESVSSAVSANTGTGPNHVERDDDLSGWAKVTNDGNDGDDGDDGEPEPAAAGTPGQA